MVNLKRLPLQACRLCLHNLLPGSSCKQPACCCYTQRVESQLDKDNFARPRTLLHAHPATAVWEA